MPLDTPLHAQAALPAGLSPQERRALLAVLTGVVLATLDTAIANTALPSIAADLHSSEAGAIWVLNAYQLAVVATMLPFAALGDVIGPRRVFLGGIAVFTGASLLCTLAGNVPLLAAARALQGIGAGAMMSVNIALIRLIYPASRLGRGVGMNALVVGIGFAVGPTVASLVLALASWPWLFGINVPLGLLAMALGGSALPHSPRRPGGFDPLTAGLTALSFASLVFALTSVAQLEPWSQVLPFALLALVSGAALLRRQAGHPAPMLPVDLLRRPMFALSALTAVAAFATQGLAFVSLPFFFEQVLHRDPVQTGLLISAWPVLVALFAPVAGRLSDRHPPGLLGGVGLVLLSAGMASLALLPAQPSVADIMVRMALCGAGFGFFQAPNLKALMSSAPPERAGGASGVIGVARLLGQTSGAALVALCFHLGGTQGSATALVLGAVSAGIAAAASFMRLWV
ncbi:MAG: MFS transporter [Roseateles depolymerans]|uniref:MFS transporter n=1 Tax=Roseateles depolymerans TaxID=76731 RepID=A0A2W5FN74_9BURK|nr:MAG: MFS transporter [Roseateles depolymerans]